MTFLYCFLLACSPQITENLKRISLQERYFDLLGFQNYPAVLLLKNGDTVRGRFTKQGSLFSQIHENPDSNLYRGKSAGSHFPDYYYRRYSAPELKAYLVNGQRLEAVAVTSKKEKTDFIPAYHRYEFMIRLTPDSFALQIYKHLWHNPEATILSELLSPPDTTIHQYDYYFQYYIHFPGEHPDMAWRLDIRIHENRRLRDRFRELFQSCPPLQETLRLIEELPGTGYILRVLASPDSTFRTRGLTALLERCAVFDKCYRGR